MAKRLLPLPGAIDGKRWKITDAGRKGATQTNLQRRTMAVPQDASEEARQAQLHELAHVAFTRGDPAKIARATGLPLALVEGAEDCRLTAILSNVGLPQDAALLDVSDPKPGMPYDVAVAAQERRKRLEKAAAENDSAAALLLASLGTGDAATIREAVAAKNPNGAMLGAFVDLLAAEALTTDNPTDPDFTVRLATTVRDAMRAAEGGSGGSGSGSGEGGDGGDEQDGESDELDAMLDDVFAGLTDGAFSSGATGGKGASAPTPTPKPGKPSGSGGSGAPFGAPGTLSPTRATAGGGRSASRILSERFVQRATADPELDPGAAIGTGKPSTDGTAREAPSVAHPPDPEVRASMNGVLRYGDGQGVAELERTPVAPRRTKGERFDYYSGEYVAFEGLEYDGCRWGPFNPETDTLYPPLTVRQGRAFLPKSKRAGTDSGSVPQAMHRLAIDGRVFRGPRMRDGNAGAVLIDLSGSMSLTLGQVRAILDVMPAAIVAAYSGEPNHMAILARKGRMVSDAALRDTMTRMGGNNSIDGPCLHWLARQRGPRFWISDGGITGDSDSGVSVEMRAEVVQTCIRAKILRVGSADEVVRRFGRLKGTGR